MRTGDSFDGWEVRDGGEGSSSIGMSIGCRRECADGMVLKFLISPMSGIVVALERGTGKAEWSTARAFLDPDGTLRPLGPGGGADRDREELRRRITPLVDMILLLKKLMEL